MQPPIDLKSLEAAVFRRIEAEHGPVARIRSLSQGTRFLLLLLLVAAEAALFYLFLRRADLVDYPVDRMAISFGGYGAVLVASAWLALRPLYLPDRPLLRGALVVVGLTLPVVLALMPEVPGGLQITDDRQLRHGLFCFADGALVAAAVLVFGRLLDRGDGPGTVLAAVAAGAAGTLLLHVHCPINHPVHLLLGHATVAVVAITAGYLLHRRGAAH